MDNVFQLNGDCDGAAAMYEPTACEFGAEWCAFFEFVEFHVDRGTGLEKHPGLG